ncbi:uncharacterized protein LOC143858068 [Tasmannia lanceolata]|uniref:uncharacterized protein LOC143858068 n=1 Tax=Tasmannia lanceolata TaxID=3420 RepID=UPI004063FF07
MEISTVDSSDLRLESIPVVDLRSLSQSDLNSLSLCSDHAFDPRRSSDVVIPKIDRNIFNESAGSRKQTYSRLRLAPRTSDHMSTVGRHRRRIPASLQPSDSLDDSENKRIVTLLRDLFCKENSNHQTLTLTPKNGNPNPNHTAGNYQTLTLSAGNRNPNPNPNPNLNELAIVPAKKRGRKKGELRRSDSGEIGMDDSEIRNRNGIPVDVAALGNCDDLFGVELRRRTEGLGTESELLGFLKGLEGQWGSRRKKKKIVDANDFGDDLPMGWKILLGIKKKEGRVWLDCRRFISPSGLQFASHKEVASYLLSFIGHQDAKEPIYGQTSESTQVTHKLATKRVRTFVNSSSPVQLNPSDLWVMQQAASLSRKDDATRDVPVCYSAVPISSICTLPFASFSAVPIYSFSPDHEKKVLLFRVENSAQVQPQNLPECHKCNLIFGDKESYEKHLMDFHERSPKRCRLGKSIGDGVIIKDGKYECQFCHKIFDERHRYNGHVGTHVRYHFKNIEPKPDEINVPNSVAPSSLAGAPIMFGEKDASFDVVNDKNSIPVISTVKSIDEQGVGSSHSKQDMECETDSPMCAALEIRTLASKSVNETDNGSEMTEDNKLGNVIETSNSMNVKHNPCFDTATPLASNEDNISCGVSNEENLSNGMKEPVLDEAEKSDNKLKMGFESCLMTLPDNDQSCDVETYGNNIFTSFTNESELNEKEESGNGLETDFKDSHLGSDKDAVKEIIGSAEGEIVVESVVPDELSLFMPSSGNLPTLDMVSDKGEDELGIVSEKLENISDFEELRFDDIEPSEFHFVSGQDSSSLAEAPMDLTYGAGLEKELNTSAQFEWDRVFQFTTVCVWCGIEFHHEGVNPETQSDSVGFMCPTCKVKISGQLNVLDNGLSTNSQRL